jgi:hypothetical protein
MEGNGLRPEQRIVVKMPLVELWDDAGSIAGGRVRYLDRDQIAELLRTTPVHFVVASLWVAPQARAQKRRTEPDSNVC